MIKVNKNYLKILLTLIINLIIIYRIQIKTKFNLLLGDVSAYDNTIQATIMEHWLNFFKFKSSWLDVGYFYPYERTIAQTDAYFLTSLIYAPFRLIQFDPYLASEFTGIVLKIIGFIGVIYLCQKVFKFNLNYSLLVASLFTLNNAMTYHGVRIQLATVAFIPWIFALQYFGVINWLKKNKIKALVQLGVSFIFIGLWCITSFYISWFYLYFLLLFVIILLIIYRNNFKSLILNVIKDYKYLISLTLIFILSLVPFIYAFYPKSKETGTRIYEKMKFTAITPENFFQLGRSNKIYSPIFDKVISVISPNYVPDTWEYYNMGINFFVFILILASVVYLILKKDKVIYEKLILSLSLATLLGMLSIIRIFDKSPWFFIYYSIPGAKALGGLHAFMYVLFLPMYISAIYFLSKINFSKILKILFIIFLLSSEYNDPFIRVYRPEQVEKNVSTSQPPSTCKVFYVGGWKDQEKFYNYWEWINNQYAHNVSAMMISQLVNVPTINGFASFIPKDYDLVGPNGTAFSPNSPEYEKRISNYIEKYNLRNVCKLDLNSKTWTQIN